MSQTCWQRGVRANRPVRIEFWNLYDGPGTIKQVTQHLATYEFFAPTSAPCITGLPDADDYVVALEAG